MPTRESQYHRYPDYRVELEPDPRRVRVTLGGKTVADSRRTLRVFETRHDPVIYFPRDDVRMELLEPSEHQTFCPFKGDASYFDVRVGDRVERNLIWSYEEPFPQVAALAGYLSFYPDRVEIDEEA